jgi:DNA polymerase-3 subunit gamma/tau
MSYIVFARKYRPQNFDEVAGQEYVTRTLKNAVESKRIAHAYLFSGPRGVGKTSIARILAKAINCTDMKDNNPCGKCNSCMEITEGNSPDIIEIDGASNRGIDEIRDLRDKVKFLPVKNRFKVYIIDEVHMLTNEAFNALLKTLEEPPEHVIFIFATTDMIKVPLTVASRCQKFSFRKLTAAEIAAHLKTILNKEKIEINPKVISLISRNSDGALRDAESLLDQVISFSAGEVKLKDVQELVGTVDNTKILGIVSAASKKETESALKIINELYDIGVDTFLFIKHLAEYFRNILISKMVKDPADFMDMADPEEMAVFLSFSKEFSVSDISNIIKILTDLLEKLKYSAYPRAIIEVAVIKITRMDRLLDISEIYKAIDCSTDHTEKKTELEPKRGIKSSPDYTVAQPAENTLKITDIEDIEIEGVQGQEKNSDGQEELAAALRKD